MDCFIGLDIGTSSVKGMLLSEKAIVKTASREYPLYYPKDGWSEQNPQDWYDGSISVIKELVSDIDKNSVVSISFSGQMHGLVVLDENDNVIRPAILWNDSRSSLETEYLNNIIGKKTLQQNTGNIAFPGFTAPKILWLKNNEPENFQKAEKIMLPKDYVAYRLSGVFATDCSDAAGTLYFDTKNRCWSETMLSVLGIGEKKLPKVYESYQAVGTLKKSAADKLGLNENVKIVIGAGDNAASAVGTDTIKSGDCNISLGTSGTIFVAGDEFDYVPNGAIHTFCSAAGKYHYLACILSAASCQKWWIEGITKSSYDGGFTEYIGKSQVMFLPYLMGERSPINDSNIRGAFFGLSLNTTKDEMTLAVLEGVAFAIKQNLDIIRDLGIHIETSKICGGGTRNKEWVKIIASVLNIELLLPEVEHGAVLGAALLGARACLPEYGYERLRSAVKSGYTRVLPDGKLTKYYGEKYSKWSELYPKIKE